jgi:1-acyl-sn-glycerol-3-phosphate acyltransferase
MSLRPLPPNLPSRGNAFSRGIGHALLWVMGWTISGQLPNRKKMVIIVAPHTSNWDFVIGIAAYLAMGIRTTWFGKHTIFVGLFGRLLKWLGGIPVKRTQNHGFVGQMSDAFKKADRMLLALSPEGTRKKTTQWKKGFYFIAHESGVPILLISLDFSRKVLELGPLIVPDGNYDVQIREIKDYFSQKTPKKPSMF